MCRRYTKIKNENQEKASECPGCLYQDQGATPGGIQGREGMGGNADGDGRRMEHKKVALEEGPRRSQGLAIQGRGRTRREVAPQAQEEEVRQESIQDYNQHVASQEVDFAGGSVPL